MAVTLAAARRLGAIHHRLEPTGHVHLEHLVTLDETMLLRGGDGQRGSLVTSERWEFWGIVYCPFRLVSYQQLVVFWPFSVILCEAVESTNICTAAMLYKLDF